MLIGDRLHQLRKQKKITLSELSALSGVQLATLSRIENKKMTGTIESHMQIAKALGIDLTELYQDITNTQETIETPDRSANEIFSHSSGASFELLTKNLLYKKMMPTLIHIKGHGSTAIEEFKPGSERFIYILEGEVDVEINKQNIKLTVGNTLYFDATKQHRFYNHKTKNAVLLSVITPVSL